MKETYHSTDKTYDEYVLVSERQIEEFLSEMKNEEENNNERMRWHRMLSYEQFERMLIACAEKIMHNRGTYEKFIIDDNKVKAFMRIRDGIFCDALCPFYFKFLVRRDQNSSTAANLFNDFLRALFFIRFLRNKASRHSVIKNELEKTLFNI